MAITRMAGSGVALQPNFQAPAITPGGQPVLVGSGPLSLPAGASMILPAGQYYVQPGVYSCLQMKDPILGFWRTIETTPGSMRFVTSDGVNVRLANMSGCAVGAYITNVGSAYTSAPTVTASAGSSTWTAIVGGAVGTVTVGTAGAGYTHTPTVIFSPPPSGGVQATGIAVVSAGAISSITKINQGAGYTVAPTVTIIPDARDTITTAAAVTCALTGSGTITAIYRTDHGTPLTSVPTLSFSGGGGSSAAATVVMCFAATGFTVSNAGVAYGNAQPFLVTACGGIVAGAAGTVVNPALDKGLFVPRTGFITGTTTSGSVITATGAVVEDGGLFQRVPDGYVTPSGTAALPTTTAIVVITVGGVTDTSFLYPF
ncbi:MAG: hypothetical protein KGL39_39110 [Patescibacteria group bacterium]|nr:hypothetical protein [Patescibacteria group bacterium]